MHLLQQFLSKGQLRPILALIAFTIITVIVLDATRTVPALKSGIHSTIGGIHSTIGTIKWPKPSHHGWLPKLSGSKQYCKWEFTHYESSAFEEHWFDIIEEAQAHICETVAEPEHAEGSAKIVSRIESLRSINSSVQWTTFDSVPPAEPHPDDHLFSRMHYARTCYDPKKDAFKPTSGRGVQLIEPIWGMLRDPFDFLCGALKLPAPAGYQDVFPGQSKEAIMPQGFAPYTYDLDAVSPIAIEDDHHHVWRPHGIPPWHSSLTPSQDPQVGTIFEKPQNIFVDLGSSYFGGWGDRNTNLSTGAASGGWFYEIYHARGQPFDKYIAVELADLDPTVAHMMLPPDLPGIYNLINAPVSMEEGHVLNTLDLIKRISKPGDNFVLKLDIDHGTLEMNLVDQILADDPEAGGASGLIDELMFEHRKLFVTTFNSLVRLSNASPDVYYNPLTGPGRGPWSDVLDTMPNAGDLAYSYEVFRDLRRKSIRSHSWP